MNPSCDAAVFSGLFLFFIFAILRFEFRDLCLTTSATSPALFALVIFQEGCCIFAQHKPQTKILLPMA
jgi:hypothetical protein